MAGSRLITLIEGEITFLDDHQTKQYDRIILHPSSKWIKTLSGVQGEEVERWYPLHRIFEVRGHHVEGLSQ